MNGLKQGLFDECLYWRKRWRSMIKRGEHEMAKVFYNKYSALYDLIMLCGLDDEFAAWMLVSEGEIDE